MGNREEVPMPQSRWSLPTPRPARGPLPPGVMLEPLHPFLLKLARGRFLAITNKDRWLWPSQPKKKGEDTAGSLLGGGVSVEASATLNRNPGHLL